MAITYPTTLDAFTNPGATETLGGSAPTHSTHHANLNDAVEALEAKVGVNSSAVTTSHDYKLANCTSTAKAVADTRTVGGDGVGIEGGGALSANLTLNLKDGGTTNAKLATVATATIKGRTTAGTGAPEDLTGAQATALLSAFTGDSGAGGVKGMVPAPAAGDAAAGKFLKASGAWAVPAGGGDMLAANNLSDLVSAATARTNLGLAHANEVVVPFIIDDGTTTIATGTKRPVEVPFDGTITGWTILGDASGSCEIKISRVTYASYPTYAEISTSGERPSLSAAAKNQDLTLTTWGSVAVTAGDVLIPDVVSSSGLAWVVISLRITKS